MTELSYTRAREWPAKALAFLDLTIAGWRERHQLRRELDGLREHGQLDRTLSDSGIAASDVYRLLHAHPRTQQQLADMMRRLGIERAALPRSVAVTETLREAEWRCGECANWRKCRAWLDSPHAPGSYRDFCPNAEAFDELRCGETEPRGLSSGKPCGVLAELAAAPDGGRA